MLNNEYRLYADKSDSEIINGDWYIYHGFARRVSLVPYPQENPAHIFSLIDANRLFIELHDQEKWTYEYQTVKDIVRLITRISALEDYRYGIHNESGLLVGSIHLSSYDPAEKSAYVGYFMDQMYTGHGYAIHALSKIIELAKTKYGYTTLYAAINPQNTASIKTARKVGFAYVGKESLIKYDRYTLYLD